MNKNKYIALIVGIVVLALCVCALVWMNLQQKTEIKEIVEQMEF